MTDHYGLLVLNSVVLLALPPTATALLEKLSVQLSSSRNRMLDCGASQEDVKPPRERVDAGRRTPAAGPSLHVSVTGGWMRRWE